MTARLIRMDRPMRAAGNSPRLISRLTVVGLTRKAVAVSSTVHDSRGLGMLNTPKACQSHAGQRSVQTNGGG